MYFVFRFTFVSASDPDSTVFLLNRVIQVFLNTSLIHDSQRHENSSYNFVDIVGPLRHFIFAYYTVFCAHRYGNHVFNLKIERPVDVVLFKHKNCLYMTVYCAELSQKYSSKLIS